MEEKRMSPAATTDSPSPAVDPPASRRRGGALKRKAANFSGGNTSTPPTAPSSKRQAREKPSPVLFPPIHNGPCTRARQQPNNLFPGSETTGFWDAVVKSEAVPPEFGGGGTVKAEEELGAGKEDWEALEAKVEAEYEVVKSRDVNAHVVPNHAGWFSWSKVHPVEEQTLPSFFNGKSEKRTPEIYMEIRNSIMNKFHSNPNTPIEVKDLSEFSVGELDARQEVMEFLDYWGLINYHPLPETNTTSLTVDGDKVEKADSLIRMLYQFEAAQSISPPAPRTNMLTATVPSRLLPESVIADELARPEATGVEYHCNSCSADCSRKRYHCQKQADFDLCSECFNGRKFDSGMSPSDFILMESAEADGASGGKWTDQETLLLLEALELFSENWNEIAEHVATKTKAQCILHFIQMPIEDTFLDCDDEDDSSVKENEDAVATNNDNLPPEDAPETTDNKDEATDDQPLSAQIEISNPVEPSEPKVDQEKGSENSAVNALKEAFKTVGTLPSSAEKLSFADSGNPVMALAAFLVRLVEPNVATASSRSSLKFISSNESSMQLAARHSFLLEDPTDDKSLTETERDATETVEAEGEKGMDEMQKEEKSGRDSDDTDSSKDHDKRTDKDLNTEENELLVASKKNKALVMEELGLSDSPEKDKNMDTEEKDPSISAENPKDAIPEEKEQLTSSNVECTQNSFSAIKSDLMDTDQMVEPSLPNESNSLELQKEHLSSIAEKDNEPSRLLGDNHSTEGPKDEEIVSDTPTTLVANGGNSGEAIRREHKQENKVPLNIKDDKSIYNMKRAAVTAISAAAVKAKLLADQEEDQIRQLATSLIEKQLHKLETKLAFFSEMDNVVSRVREQLERSKQKLYHERAQIIAARLGISAASSRPAAPQSLPNRAAMAFPNAMARPPMSLTPQRPPISRPMMPPGTPSSNPIAPATVTASNQDNPAAVGIK